MLHDINNINNSNNSNHNSYNNNINNNNNTNNCNLIVFDVGVNCKHYTITAIIIKHNLGGSNFYLFDFRQIRCYVDLGGGEGVIYDEWLLPCRAVHMQPVPRRITLPYITFIHLANAFIQSDSPRSQCALGKRGKRESSMFCHKRRRICL